MATGLASSMASLSLCSTSSSRPQHSCRPTLTSGFSCAMRGQVLQVKGAPLQRTGAFSRSSLIIEAKQNAKQRERLSEKQRLYNKSRKSAVATRLKKVLVALQAFGGKVESEEVLKPVEKLISEAYSEIDKAVVKGVLHKNTGANRKSRIATAKTKLMVSSGLFTPSSSGSS